MNAEKQRPYLKWVVKFKVKEEFLNVLVDLKDTNLFQKKYPVFKMKLADDLLSSKVSHYFHIKREEHDTDVKDTTGQSVPLGSCIFLMGVSKDLGICKMLFFPQPEERLVLVALDEVWIKVLESMDESQRMSTLTNVAASFITNPSLWSQVYLLY